MIRFGHYYRFFFENGTDRLLEEAELEIRRNCLLDGISLLGRQLEKIRFVSDKTVLASYLNSTSRPLRSYDEGPLIFPFGCNESQKKAVEAALCSQLTLIEGPPGTGKTQTILNLIANLMIQGKRIAVVSNNNSATDNVYEKLDKHDLAFLCAVLGNADNKQRFIKNQTKYEVRKPEMPEAEWLEILETTDGMQKKLSEYLVWKNKLAQLETDYNSILLEQTHFQNYMEETFRKEKRIDIALRLSSTRVLVLKTSLEAYAEKYGREELSWIQKLRLFLFYRIRNREFLNDSLDEILTEFERQFYDLKRKELEEEQDQIQAKLDHFRYEDKKLEMEQLSMVVLKEKIAQYYSKHRRLVFDRDDIWKNPEKILACYPIVLALSCADNPNLLNVAVSRAVKKLRLLISDNEKNDNTNIRDLVRYIAYEKGEVVSGKVYSVFALLYKDYRKVREAYLKNKRRVSEVESENLFYHYLQEFFGREGYVDLDIAVHMPLRMIIKDVEGFDEEEVRFAMHRSTHVDFLIYKKIDKQPVLAIEVDGERYHRKGSIRKYDVIRFGQFYFMTIAKYLFMVSY